jgi:putative acetyltransferase
VPASIRSPSEADILALALLAHRSYCDAFAPILPAEVLALATADRFATRFRDRLAEVRAAVDDTGTLLGFTLTTDEHLDLLFVEPSARGRAIGSLLLADAIERGCRTVESFAANHAARRFYDRRGFRLEQAYDRVYDGAVLPFVRLRLAVAGERGGSRPP